MARDRKNYSYLITALKIISPALFALFIFLTKLTAYNDREEGTYKILNNEEYIKSFVSDTAKA